MKLTIAVVLAFLLAPLALPVHAGSPTHPKPHKVKKHKGVKHRS